MVSEGVHKRKKRTPEFKAKMSAIRKGQKHSVETRRKMSNAQLKEKNYQWKGGCSAYYHRKARELFGAPFCQDCGITLEEYIQNKTKHPRKKFDMHCVSEDYTILESWNWENICRKCHWKTYSTKKENINEAEDI